MDYETDGITVGITGGAGFVGSHVTDYFVSQGVETVVIDNLSSGDADNLDWALAQDNCELRKTDLSTNVRILEAFEGIDRVVHMAALVGGIGYFNESPASIIQQNTRIDGNVLDAAHHRDVDRLVYASSSCVFDQSDQPTDSGAFLVHGDDHYSAPPPTSAYGASKLAGEYFCRAFHAQHGLEYSIVRPFNAIGPREPPGDEVGKAHVVPDLVKKILDERQHPLTILGDGEQVRSLTNVADIARGVFRCTFDDAAAGEDFNLGNPEPATIRTLARVLWDVCDRDEEFALEHAEAFDHDVAHRAPDPSKAQRELGWAPEWSTRESLEQYVEWYRGEVLGDG